ncbi:MAG: LCP family protein [Eubacteriales bacterium]|nr:LCP family protein [Eubacteriales bacterium]
MSNSRKSKIKNTKKRKKKKSLIGRFFGIVFSILVIYFMIIAGLFAYSYLTYDSTDKKENPNFIDKVVEKVKPSLPEYTNVLLACTDKSEGRTDGIMLVSYNSVNKKVSVVSIPRDTKVSIPDDMWEIMVQNFPVIKNDNPSLKKINAIPNYGQEQGMEFLQTYLEDLLGIKIDYYAHFDFEGFRYIIDSVGGIEFDVPIRMNYYDPTQDFRIDLKPGVQLLDGDKSEQLLRFRKRNDETGYPRGDLDRVEVQQQFMKVFLEKVTSLDSILSNPSAYFTTATEYLDTNVSLSDILKYLPEANSFDVANVETYTLPGTPKTINRQSYVVLDEDEIAEFSYEVFKKPAVKPEDIVYEESYDKSIIILNGGYTSGMAGKAKEILEDNGYIIGEIGDYNDTKAEETKIYVSKEGQGNDLEKFFTNAKVTVNPMKIEEFGYDIVIILGTKEELKESSVQE